MGRFDNTESAYLERKIDSQVSGIQFGEVVEVYEHTQADDNSNFEVDVILRDEAQERREVPIMTARRGEISVPEVGDTVLVGFLDGVSEAPVVLGNIYTDQTRPPLGRAGMYRLTRGSLYVEAHEEGDWARISKKPSDDGSATSKIEVDDSGATTQINIETDGDITLSAGGDIVIDEGGTATPVAKQDHTHDYDDDDGSTVTTKTTTTPNESGTKTEIE